MGGGGHIRHYQLPLSIALFFVWVPTILARLNQNAWSSHHFFCFLAFSPQPRCVGIMLIAHLPSPPFVFVSVALFWAPYIGASHVCPGMDYHTPRDLFCHRLQTTQHVILDITYGPTCIFHKNHDRRRIG